MNIALTETAHVELARAASELSPALRQRLAHEWACAGQAQHASTAAYGRFALELLASDAPRGLVTGVHRAALDEIRHAQRYFDLASIYERATVVAQPVVLDAHTLSRLDLQRAVYTAVIDGCVGETLAAVEAAHASSLSQWRTLRALLATIAHEESAHASLAFRFISWAIDKHGSSLRSTARDAFETAAARVRALPLPQPDPQARTVLAHGRLCARERHVLRLRALDQLVAPLAHELCPRRPQSSVPS